MTCTTMESIQGQPSLVSDPYYYIDIKYGIARAGVRAQITDAVKPGLFDFWIISYPTNIELGIVE